MLSVMPMNIFCGIAVLVICIVAEIIMYFIDKK